MIQHVGFLLGLAGYLVVLLLASRADSLDGQP